MAKDRKDRSENPLYSLTWNVLYSLDRQTIRAHRMEIDWSSAGIDKKRADPLFKEYADLSIVAFAILFGGDKKKRLSADDWRTFIIISPAGIYFSLWLSLLYSVIERLRIELRNTAGSSDLSFLKHYDAALVKKIEGLRQTIFHVPVRYWDQRRLHRVLEPGIAKQAWLLHKELMDEFTTVLKAVRRQSSEGEEFARLAAILPY